MAIEILKKMGTICNPQDNTCIDAQDNTCIDAMDACDNTCTDI